MKMKQEVFAVGRWNGLDFELADLKVIASNFHRLKENLSVPLKLGHNEEQPVKNAEAPKDGQPALGWVTDVYVDTAKSPAKLIAEFDNVPDVLFKAMEEKLYRSVSIELDFGIEYKGDYYEQVLTAVAVLGADAPAVNVLNDLTEFMSVAPRIPQTPFTSHDVALFTASATTKPIEINFNSGGNGMPLSEEEIRKLQADNLRLTAENSALVVDKDNVTKQFSTFKSDTEKDKAEAQKAALKTKREEVSAKFEKAVKDGAISPAERESFCKMINIEDDTALKALDVESVDSFIKEQGEKKVNFGKDTTHSEIVLEDELKEGETLDGKLTTMTHKYAAEKSVSFSTAQTQVMRANPNLAKAYFSANGEV